MRRDEFNDACHLPSDLQPRSSRSVAHLSGKRLTGEAIQAIRVESEVMAEVEVQNSGWSWANSVKLRMVG